MNCANCGRPIYEAEPDHWMHRIDGGGDSDCRLSATSRVRVYFDPDAYLRDSKGWTVDEVGAALVVRYGTETEARKAARWMDQLIAKEGERK